MKVILIADVKKVGQRGSVVTVADGYALNVLIPQKKAVPATPENLKRHEANADVSRKKAEQDADRIRKLLAEIDGKTLSIEVKAGPTGTLFKSLHASDIVREIKKQWGTDLPESAVTLDHPIKQKGTISVPLELLGARANIFLEV